MRTSWEKFVQHVGTKYGQDISNDLNNNIKVNIGAPVHSTQVLVRHNTQESLVHTGQSNIQTDFWSQSSMLRAAATADPSDADLPTNIEILDNDIAKGDFDLSRKFQ